MILHLDLVGRSILVSRVARVSKTISVWARLPVISGRSNVPVWFVWNKLTCWLYANSVALPCYQDAHIGDSYLVPERSTYVAVAHISESELGSWWYGRRW
jgi:hypothetical protein